VQTTTGRAASASRALPPRRATAPLTDYGGRHVADSPYLMVQPVDLDSLQGAIAWAVERDLPLRVRGNGHSMNGSSVPRANELLISMRECRHFRFEEPGTVSVGAGAAIWDLNELLKTYGYELLVYNIGDSAAASVGGYLSAGGFGETSRQYGGFWETVMEVVLVSGKAQAHRFTPTDPEFRWLFGAMGQLGVAFELKLCIKPTGRTPRAYPMGDAGPVPRSNTPSETLQWYTLFVPESDWRDARTRLWLWQAIITIGARYKHAWRGRWPYVYSIRFGQFNPPLIHPAQESLIAFGLWGTPRASGFDWQALSGIEAAVDQLAADHPRCRRYVQVELMPDEYDYRGYFGERMVQGFDAVKRALDPDGVLGAGLTGPGSPAGLQ
jgi:hypothetical protein